MLNIELSEDHPEDAYEISLALKYNKKVEWRKDTYRE